MPLFTTFTRRICIRRFRLESLARIRGAEAKPASVPILGNRIAVRSRQREQLIGLRFAKLDFVHQAA